MDRRQRPDPGRIVVIGGGPCGLACAEQLQRAGHHDWVLLEAAAKPGGLATSVVDPEGFTWDLGGHVVFSHFGEFDRLLAELFEPEELLHHDRASYIRFRDRWVPYPFQQHLHTLPAEDEAACHRDLQSARQRAAVLPASANLAAWLQAQFGAALVERFFGPYNRKVWTCDPQQLASSWVAERIAPPNRAPAPARPPAAAPSRRWGPNATFAFPRQGGTGEIWQRLGRRLEERLRTGARVIRVDPTTKTVTCADGRFFTYDHLVVTLPLDVLTEMVTTAPDPVRAAARRLRHTSVAMVGLGYRSPMRDTRSWLYFPQHRVPFYRATNFGKYAPANVPGADPERFSAWMTETALAPGRRVDRAELISACDQALRRHGLVPRHAPVVSAHLEFIPYAYPIPMLDRDEALAAVTPWLEAHGIYPRGRFGTWRYEIGNMDHAVKMGLDVARRLLHGATEDLVVPTPTAVPAGHR